MIDATNAHESAIHQFVTFASDLALSPGDFPDYLPTTFGNGQSFVRQRMTITDGEIIAAHYRQLLGIITLTIYND